MLREGVRRARPHEAQVGTEDPVLAHLPAVLGRAGLSPAAGHSRPRGAARGGRHPWPRRARERASMTTAEQVRTTVRQAPATLIERLADPLERAGISYCQWKGHSKRTRWLTGAGDLDLLVDPAAWRALVEVRRRPRSAGGPGRVA